MPYYLAGIDLGSTAVRVVVQKAGNDKEPEIIARAEIPVVGGVFFRGNINRLEKLQKHVDKAVQEAEVMAGVDVEEAFVGIASWEMRGIYARGKVTVQGKNSLVTEDDIRRVHEMATPSQLSESLKVFSLLPYIYELDGQTMVSPPLGMKGRELLFQGYLLVAPEGVINNTQIACSHRGLHVLALIFEPLAGLSACVLPDIWDRGVLYIDIGQDTTEVVVGHRKGILYAQVIPVGGKLFTQDLSAFLDISYAEAEKIKITRGTVLYQDVSPDEAIQLYTAGSNASKVASLKQVASALGARGEELFEIIRRELQKHKLLEVCQRGYLAGGGAKLEGMLDLAQRYFSFPVTLAQAYGYKGLTDRVGEPAWMTALGLVRWGDMLYPKLRKSRRSIFNIFRRFFPQKT